MGRRVHADTLITFYSYDQIPKKQLMGGGEGTGRDGTGFVLRLRKKQPIVEGTVEL